MKRTTSMGQQAINYTRLLTNNPAEAWNSCNQNLSRPNITSDQKKEWEERLQKAEQAVAEKRKTDANYALHIKLSETLLSERKSETPRISAITNNSSPNKQNDTPSKLNKPALDLSKIENKPIETPRQAPRGNQATPQAEVRAILNSSDLDTFFQKATSGYPNDALDFYEKQMLLLNKTPLTDTLYEIHRQELLHWNSLKNNLNQKMLDVVKGFINPKPSKGIDLDYYHKSILSISNLIPFIDPKQFPKLHKIATDGDNKIDEEILQTFLRTLGISVTISLGTALAPLLKTIEGITLTISILGSIVLIFPVLMVLSIAYILMLVHYRNQALMAQLRTEFNSYEQKTV